MTEDDATTARPRGSRGRAVARGLGELLVTVGVVLLLFVVYEVFVTDLLTEQRQAELTDELYAEWADEPPVPGSQVPGDALAVLYIPRLGADYRQVVLEGTAEEQLSQGPGHYEGSALPGEEGNLAIAGHRVGKGSPFLELDTLRPGDPIVVETADAWFTYRVLGNPATGEFTGDPSGVPGQQIVRPTQVDVIAPVPGGDAHGAPDGAFLTLTTCHPRFSAEQRLIVHAALDGAPLLRADAPDGPPALRDR